MQSNTIISCSGNQVPSIDIIRIAVLNKFTPLEAHIVVLYPFLICSDKVIVGGLTVVEKVKLINR